MLNNALLDYLVLGLVCFFGGFIAGYIIRDYRFMMKDGTRDNGSVVLLTVTLVWAISMLVDIVSPNYETSPLVHGLMGAIVGYFYKPKLNEKTPRND